MATDVFIQRTRFGRSIYLLKTNSLEITTAVLGKSSTVEIALSSISPDYTIHSRRMLVFCVVPAVMALIAFLAADFIADLQIVPGAFVFYCVVFGIVGIAATVTGLRRVEYFNFYDHEKAPLFSVVRETEQKEICNDFVAALVDRLEQVESGVTFYNPETPSATKKNSIALPVDEDMGPKSYWKLAFVAAVIGIAYPPIEAFSASEALFGFLVVIGALTCAISACVASFSKKEPKKYWSLLGVALSCVPFAIY